MNINETDQLELALYNILNDVESYRRLIGKGSQVRNKSLEETLESSIKTKLTNLYIIFCNERIEERKD